MKEKKQGRMRTILYGILAVVLFCLLYAISYPLRKPEKTYAPEIVVLGDSIMGQVRDETSVTALLSQRLQKEVFNGAMGGTCLARTDYEKRMGYTKDSLSLIGLSKAIATDDFGPQQATRIRQSATEYFPEVVDTLETIDFSKVKTLLIQYGLNDYHAEEPITNTENPLDEYTFTGALRYSLQLLQETYPDMRIVLVTSTYSWYTTEFMTCEDKNFGYGILEDYVNAELQVAEELGVEVIDVYHDYYPTENWEDWSLYNWDGLHPNEAGRSRLAQTIAEYLSEER